MNFLLRNKEYFLCIVGLIIFCISGYLLIKNNIKNKILINNQKQEIIQLKKTIENNNKIVYKYQSEITNLNESYSQRINKLRNEKDTINATNFISYNFVQLLSENFKLSESATNINEKDKSVPTDRILSYILDLQQHDKSCVIQLNNLIDWINLQANN
jgi:hypothetical protein